MKNEKRKTEVFKIKRILFIAFLIIAIYVIINNLNKTFDAIKFFLNIIKPFLYGVLLGYLFLFPVRKIQKLITRGKKTKYDNTAKIFSLILVYLIFFLSIYFLMSWVLPFLYNAAIDILQNAPNYLDSLEEWTKGLNSNKLASKINIDELFKHIRSLDMSKIMLNSLKNFNVQNGINAIFSAAEALAKTFIVIVVSFNIILYSDSLNNEIRLLSQGILGSKKTKQIKRVITKMDEVFVNFIYGQVIDSIIVSIIFVIALLLLRVKHAVALGILIGIGNLIPYVGAFISIGITVLITCFTGGIPKGVLILIVTIILQQIDAQIINPAIIGDQLDLNPPLIILAILIGGAYFGPIVVFLAAPVLAVIKSMLIEYIENKRCKIKIDKLRNIRPIAKISSSEKYKQEFKFCYKLNYKKQQEDKKRKHKLNQKKIKKPNLNKQIKAK